MAAEAIANFDSYVWVAVGMFVAGLFAVMVYERERSKSKGHEQQGTAARDTEK